MRAGARESSRVSVGISRLSLRADPPRSPAPVRHRSSRSALGSRKSSYGNGVIARVMPKVSCDCTFFRIYVRYRFPLIGPRAQLVFRTSPTLGLSNKPNYRRTPLAPQLCFVMVIAISEFSATVSHISRWSCQSLAWQSLSQYASPQRHSAVHCRPQ